jgi:hypothetical protein
MDSLLGKLDKRLLPFRQRLMEALGIAHKQASAIATTIFSEVKNIDDDLIIGQMIASSPLSLKHRLFFFEDFLIWDEYIVKTLSCPPSGPVPPVRLRNAFSEMLVLVQLYCSFVFVGDGLFEVLARRAPPGSCLRTCAGYIRENPLRALRNADEILRSHCIAPEHLRADRFWEFYAARAEALLQRIEAATSKTITREPDLFRPGVVAEAYDEGPEEWDAEEPLEEAVS